MLLLALLLACLLLASIASFWCIQKLKKHPEERSEIFGFHVRLMAAQRMLLVVGYVFFVYFSAWPALVVHPQAMNLGYTVIGDELLQLLPFILGCLVLWLGSYPASRQLSPATWGLGGYLKSEARGVFFLLGPWLGFMVIAGSRQYWPAGINQVYLDSPLLQGALYLLSLLAVVVLMPFYISWLWPRQTFPAGPFKDRLEAMLARAGVRCRQLLVWKTGRAKMANAAVMGVVPWARYIVFTDALLEDLDQDEVAAVLGHELGHVKHHHMVYYLLVTVAFLGLFPMLLAVLPEWLVRSDTRSSNWSMGIIMIVMVAFYWRIVFGFLSRRFERQADLVACQLTGDPGPLMSSLEKLARLSGHSPTARNWRHYSVAQRVVYLARFGYNPDAIGEYHFHIRFIKGVIIVMATVLGVMAMRGWPQEEDLHARQESELRSYLQEHNEDYEKKFELGRILIEDAGRLLRWAEEYETEAMDRQAVEARERAVEKCREACELFGQVCRMNRHYPGGPLGKALVRKDRKFNEFFSASGALTAALEAERLSLSWKPGSLEARRLRILVLQVLAQAALGAEKHKQALDAAGRLLKLMQEEKQAGVAETRKWRLFKRSLERAISKQSELLKGNKPSGT